MIAATMLSSAAAFSFSRNGAKFGARVSLPDTYLWKSFLDTSFVKFQWLFSIEDNVWSIIFILGIDCPAYV